MHFHFFDQGYKPAEYDLRSKYPTSYSTRVANNCLVGAVCIRAKRPIRPELNYLHWVQRKSVLQRAILANLSYHVLAQKSFQPARKMFLNSRIYYSSSVIWTSRKSSPLMFIWQVKNRIHKHNIQLTSLDQTLLSLHTMFSSYLVINVSPNDEVSVSLSLSLFSALLGRESCATADEPRRGKLGDVSMVSINGREILLNQPAYSLFSFLITKLWPNQFLAFFPFTIKFSFCVQWLREANR